MEPNLMLLEMWAVMNKNTPNKTNMGVYGMNFYTNDVGIIVNSYKDP